MNDNSNLLLYEADNIRQKTSGLPMIVYVGVQNDNPHGDKPFLKVQQDYNTTMDVMDNTVVTSIEVNPEILNGVWKLSDEDYQTLRLWIYQNLKYLLFYWFGAIDTAQFSTIHGRIEKCIFQRTQ